MHSIAQNLLSLLSIGLVQLVAIVSPGPSFMITAQTAVAHSRSEGVKVAIGLGAGSIVWAIAALLGLSALFHALPAVFVVMKVIGALFIIRVAYQIFKNASKPLQVSDGRTDSNPFVKGFLTQISNPKVAMFFGSIFISMLPEHAPLWVVAGLFIVIFFNDVSWFSLVSILFGSRRVRDRYLRAKTWMDRVTAVFLGGLGLDLLWTSRSLRS